MLFVKYNNADFLGFEFAKHLHSDWKYQGGFPGKVRTYFEYVVYERAFCYSVSEDRMGCWCRISSGLTLGIFVCWRENSGTFIYLLYWASGCKVSLISYQSVKQKLHTINCQYQSNFFLIRPIYMYQEAPLAHHQWVHSCIKQYFKHIYHLQYVVELTQIRQCVILRIWI